MGYAGGHRVFTYASLALSAISALMALIPFLYIWMILRDVLAAAPDYAQTVNIPHYGWMAVLFAVLSYLVYVCALLCSHLSAFRVATNLRLAVTKHLAELPLGFTERFGSGQLRKIIQESTGAAETYLAHQLPDQAGAMATQVGLLVLLFAFERGSAFAIPAALCIGLGMDLGAGGGSFVHAASYAFSAVLVNVTARGNRVASALWFALSILCFALPMNAHAGLVLLYEGLAATLLFLLIPSRFLRGKRLCSDEAAQEDAAVRRKIAASAAALRELYDSIARPRTLTEENPAAIFDRAAEKVCRGCALCSYCWEKEYQRTYTALNDATAALLRRGQGRGEDFPSYFSERCIHFSSFLSAVNGELRAYLLRRQYRRLLEDDRAKAASQYAQLSELMQSAADGALRPVSTQPVHSYEIGLSLRPKRGERVSGDSAAHFETEDGTLCLLLSDGMGCGEAAQRESSMAARLLERFLRAGIDAPPALKTLNSALSLRAESTDSFTTVDLLTLSLQTLEGELYKYGAAPSYLKRGGTVRRVTCSCLPAGLQEGSPPPEATHIKLSPGCFFVMLSDGVADSLDDEWLQNLLAGWEGHDPQQLVAAILADSMEKRGGTDDAGVLALYIPEDSGGAQAV